jgi:hypothetical protein
MVAGFITFTETFLSRQLDRRLLLAGYPRLPMLMAKLAAIALTAAALALYTTILLCISLPVRHAAPLALALAGAGLAYGGIGLLLGSLVRGELEGFFLIIMLSLVDTGLQNPVFNTLMDVAGVSALPLYGVTQLALSSALTPHIPWSYGLLTLTWSGATGALALLVLHAQRPSRSPWLRRTRVQAG